MESFTAIDFETAQGYRWSICQVGLVRVEMESLPKKSIYWLNLQIITIGVVLQTFTAFPPKTR